MRKHRRYCQHSINVLCLVMLVIAAGGPAFAGGPHTQRLYLYSLVTSPNPVLGGQTFTLTILAKGPSPNVRGGDAQVDLRQDPAGSIPDLPRFVTMRYVSYDPYLRVYWYSATITCTAPLTAGTVRITASSYSDSVISTDIVVN